MRACVLLAIVAFTDARLTVSNGTLAWNGSKAFLNGINQAWIHYGADFGNNQSHGLYCALKETLANTSAHGGHAMRIWLHIEGDNTPQFDSDGFVVGTDAAGSLISDMRRYLRASAELDVLVFFVLWNGAVLRNNQTKALFSSPPKLQSYLDKVLTPMAAALAEEPALGGWEIINEPEGSVAAGVADADACYDTMALKGTGAGWAQPEAERIAMRDVLSFIGKQAAVIHAAAPKALVTVGSWSEIPISPALGLKDFYTPACLTKAAGGVAGAALDFAQVHSYATDGGQFNPTSPFKHGAEDYALAPTPLLVGEFSPGKMAAGETAEQLYGWAHGHGYAGAWGWTATSAPSLFDGMASLRHAPDVAVVALPHKGGPDTCNCSDVPPPPGQYTCEQQAGWGKCDASFMAGYCCRSCHACSKECTHAAAAEAAVAAAAAGLVEEAPLAPPPSWQPDWPHEAYREYVERAKASMLK